MNPPSAAIIQDGHREPDAVVKTRTLANVYLFHHHLTITCSKSALISMLVCELVMRVKYGREKLNITASTKSLKIRAS